MANKPSVLIVDDDIDCALATQKAFNQLGCKTEVVTTHDGLHQKIEQSALFAVDNHEEGTLSL